MPESAVAFVSAEIPVKSSIIVLVYIIVVEFLFFLKATHLDFLFFAAQIITKIVLVGYRSANVQYLTSKRRNVYPLIIVQLFFVHFSFCFFAF